MRFRKDESGQGLVLTALCLPFLLGIVGLATDVGYLHVKQAQLQTAADAAAVAAGLEIANCSSTGGVVCDNMKAAAGQALIEDGITSATIKPTSGCTVSNSTGLAMLINVGPCVLGSGDPNHGDAYMAEVVLTEPQNSFFASMVGIRTFNLVARSEAGEAYYLSNGGGNCIYTKALAINSGGNLDLSNCGIYDGGNFQSDSGAKTTATTFLYSGTWSPNNCNGNSCNWTLGGGQTQPTHTNSAQSDPLAGLTAPSQPGTSSTNTQTPTSGQTLQPGYYPNGFNLNSSVTVNLSPGLYYMGGSINVGDGANLECTACTGGQGVTLYFAGGSLQANSGSNIELTAPATGSTSNGDVANMLLWAGPNAQNMTIDSGSQSYFSGIIYLPTQSLTLNSGSQVTINGGSVTTAIDVNSLMVDSGDHFVINGSGSYLGSGSQTLGSFAIAE
jgi:Flp pilus assembly protein TadG